MTYNEVITRLCVLRSKVMRKVFNSRYPADCICEYGHTHWPGSFQSHEFIMDWIEHAVNECIELHANGFKVQLHLVSLHPTPARTIPLSAFVSKRRAIEFVERNRVEDIANGDVYQYSIVQLTADMTSGEGKEKGLQPWLDKVMDNTFGITEAEKRR